MNPPLRLRSLLAALLGTLAFTALAPAPALADSYTDPSPPLLSIAPTNGQFRVDWTPYPATESYRLWIAPSAGAPFSEFGGPLDSAGATLGPSGAIGLFRLEAVPESASNQLTAALLNRIAYGPTPDEWPRVKAMGPEAYIAEQLAPEKITEDLPHDRHHPRGEWQYITASGTGSSSALYLYLLGAGEGYLDDLKLVAGSVAESGANLLRNGDFEAPLSTNDWVVASNHLGSALTSEIKHSGNASLHVVATVEGSTRASAIVQDITPALSSSTTYTLSFWWLPSTNAPANLTARLSGSGLTGTTGALRDELDSGLATINDLRAWHTLNAVYSRRQWLEVMLQFLDNHFVTQYIKTVDYIDSAYPDNTDELVATELEFRELQRWRQALLEPDCTFLDLLRISAESPAMIIYLDTVDSKGNGNNIANENYARELLELFTFGVDNGYDQNDIVEMSRIWTGWSIRYVAPGQENNPFAVRSDALKPGAPAGSTAVTNNFGVWAFNYKGGSHSTNTKYLFYEHNASGERTTPKTYPARFGSDYAGKPYDLTVRGLAGTNGIAEAYQVLAYLADQPFTQEYLSVKLCRLLVHDDFRHGVYDYTAANPSPEAALVRDCMAAWNSTTPKGQIRKVVKTILDSSLFRGNGGSRQKIKTPLEFAVSAVRALLAQPTNGVATASTDGYSLRNPVRRAGAMDLFNRAEPDGYPEAGPPWISAGTLSERLRFVQAYLMPTSYSAKSGDAGLNAADPSALVRLRLAAEQQKDAQAVADLFVGLLFPGEGHANLASLRGLAANFLDTADDGVTRSPFANLATTGSPSAYEVRLRGMVAMLLTTPRFQEQ